MKISDVVNIMEALHGHSDRRIDRDEIIDLGMFALNLDEQLGWANEDNQKLKEDCDRLRAELDDANGAIR